MPSYKETLRYLYGLEKLGIKPGLARIKALLSTLGNPQKNYSSILVGGTNGKGSTSAIMESALGSEGYRVGLYTSPHLVRFNERIRVSGTDITDKEVVDVFRTVKKAANGLDGSLRDVSFFEFTTAMALEYFKLRGIDLAVLEVGMGGRWDATNVVDPLVSVITNIGLEHQEYLGRTLKSIAREKAGIIKPGVPIVTGVEDEGVLGVLSKYAQKNDASLYETGRDFRIKAKGSKAKGSLSRKIKEFDYLGMRNSFKDLSLNLRGSHQIKNAACALAVLELIGDKGYPMSGKAIRKGLKKVLWPGRLEIARKNPAVILDCAHNHHGAVVLKDALKEINFKRLILVLGIMADKDIDGILSALVPMSQTVVITAPKMERAAPVELLHEKLKPYPVTIKIKRSVKSACKEALKQAAPKDLVCITGSIFTVGEAKEFLK